MEVDIALIAEHKLDTTQPRVLKQLNDEARKIFGLGSFTITAASTPIPAATRFKPGGVLSLVQGDVKGRILETGCDPLGRWAYTKLRRSNGPPITIIVTYQVVDNDPKAAGPTTYATQLYSLYTRENRPSPDKLRRHHAEDLTTFIKQCQAKGEWIIVAGDFNEVLGLSTQGLTKLHSECDLLDACLEKHGITDFTTYQRGSKVIDYILVDRNVYNTITSVGYEPFNFHLISDHRGIYIDLVTNQCFGSSILPAQPVQLRDISTKRSHQIAPYFNHKLKHLEDHKWFEKLDTLSKHMQEERENHELAEDLYERLISASVYAGSHLKRYPPAPYSPTIAHLRNVHRLLKLAVTQFKTNRDMTENIARTRAKMGTAGYELPSTLEACRQALSKCTRQLKATLKEELEKRPLRKTHQTAMIHKHEASGNTKLAKKIKGMMRAEEVKRVYQRCRAARGMVAEGGLTHVLVPTNQGENPRTCTDWRRVDCPAELEALLMERNRKHFGQSKGCTWTSPPLDCTMKFSATCDMADAILAGEYLQPQQANDTEQSDSEATDEVDAGSMRSSDEANQEHDETDTQETPANRPLHLQRSELPDLVQMLVDSFRYVSPPDAISPEITEKEYREKLKAWDERTSTSPTSNMHLGHLKAYWAEHTCADGSPEAIATDDCRRRILDGHLTLLNYAIQFGYSYNKWKHIINTMLEKDPGVPKIHRLRVIHLYEADFNLMLGVKWRQVLHHAVAQGYLNEGCYGSQPGKEATDALLIRELEYEMSRLTRKPCLHFDNDATSCYDRIPCFLANLASRKYGMHRKICVVQGETLEQAQYYLKTKYGVSENFIKHSEAHPLFGSGQGSGNSPTYWLFISSTLFDIYDKKAHGSTYQSWDKSVEVKINAVGFVDDVRTSVNAFENNTITLDQLILMAQRDSQLWHDILTASNQALELPKCGYHAIIFEFEPTGTPIMVEDPQCQLTLHNSSGQPFDIDKWKTTKSTKYLGAHKSPASQDQQAKVLQKKCDDFARVINCSHLSRTETQCFYWAIYRLSANYVLPTTHFTKRQLQQIQSRAHTAMVAKSGYCRTTARPIIYGPKKYGGAGFFHLYDDQGYGQIRSFMKLWRSPRTQAGKLLRIVMSWAQYGVGTSNPILQDVTTKWPHFEAKWLSSLRNYLRDIGGKIRLADTGVCKLQRVNDKFIMDVALNSGKFSAAALKRINYCRMYLNVLLVSDITSPDGKRIDNAAFEGDRDTLLSLDAGHSVNQERPNEKAWSEWRKCLRLLTSQDRQHTLQEPLGPWIVKPSDYARQWPLFYSASTDKIYHATAVGYSIHSRLHHDFDKDTDTFSDDLPSDAVPIERRETQHTWILSPTVAKQDLDPVPDTISTFSEAVVDLHRWERSMLENTTFIVPEAQVWTALCNSKCLVASDGSAPSDKGSFAWVLSDASGQRLAKCHGPVFGSGISSYRAEGYGMLSFLRFLRLMQSLHHRQGDTLVRPHLVCDNQGLVTKIGQLLGYPTIFPNTTLEAEWDVLAQILETNRALQTSFPTIDHIKGHQDEDTPYEALPLLAQLNCDADTHANTFLQSHSDLHYTTVHQFPAGECVLELQDGTVTRNIKTKCSEASTLPAFRTHVYRRSQWWNESVFDLVDWQAHGRALKRHGKHHTTLVKFIHQILPIGKQVHRYDPKYPQSCPSCQSPLEDMNHFWRCPSPSRLQWRQNFLSEMKTKLIALGSDPQVRDYLISQLRAVLLGGNPGGIPEDPRLQEIYTQQRQIGWDQLLRGRFAKAWGQHCCPPTTAPTKRQRTWTTDVVDFIYSEWWKLWEIRNQDRHGRDLATRLQAEARQADRELTMFYEDYEEQAPQHLKWLFDTPLAVRKQWPTRSIRQWLNTWSPILSEEIAPEADPNNQENYPHNTALETG